MTEPNAREPLNKSDFWRLLKNRRGTLVVWGLGHIGSITLRSFSALGIETVGVDPCSTARQVAEAMSPTSLVVETPDERCLTEALVHFVAIPTERHGTPWDGPLNDVLSQLLMVRRRDELAPAVVIESTLTPGTTERVIEPLAAELGSSLDKDLVLTLAPRRDWFAGAERNLATIDRVFATYRAADLGLVGPMLSKVSGPLHRASSISVCELVKVTENALRHLGIMMADQLAIAYPEQDINEVLRLAGTKWNVPEYYVGFGTGGYCIPLAGRYLLEGTSNPSALSLLIEAQKAEQDMRRVAFECVRESKAKSVLVLGLSYRPEVRVSSGSPSSDVSQQLLAAGLDVAVHDPRYLQTEITDIVAGVTPFQSLLGEASTRAAVLIMADYEEYHDPALEAALKANKNLRVIVDSVGRCAGANTHPSCRYVRPGSPGWLTQPPERSDSQSS